jgi:hypothetical protein
MPVRLEVRVADRRIGAAPPRTTLDRMDHTPDGSVAVLNPPTESRVAAALTGPVGDPGPCKRIRSAVARPGVVPPPPPREEPVWKGVDRVLSSAPWTPERRVAA